MRNSEKNWIKLRKVQKIEKNETMKLQIAKSFNRKLIFYKRNILVIICNAYAIERSSKYLKVELEKSFFRSSVGEENRELSVWEIGGSKHIELFVQNNLFPYIIFVELFVQNFFLSDIIPFERLIISQTLT